MVIKRYEERLSAVESERKRRTINRRVVVFVASLFILAFLFYQYILDRPVHYTKIEEHFKYGSIGADYVNGVPYWNLVTYCHPCSRNTCRRIIPGNQRQGTIPRLDLCGPKTKTVAI